MRKLESQKQDWRNINFVAAIVFLVVEFVSVSALFGFAYLIKWLITHGN